MNRYKLIWYNYITQEDRVEYIQAKDEADAREIAILWIKRWIGTDNPFIKTAIKSLTEYSKIEDITRESIQEYYNSKYQVFSKSACDWSYHAACVADVDCFVDCRMPCPYDRKQSPCDMCAVDNCNRERCIALKIYKENREK